MCLLVAPLLGLMAAAVVRDARAPGPLHVIAGGVVPAVIAFFAARRDVGKLRAAGWGCASVIATCVLFALVWLWVFGVIQPA